MSRESNSVGDIIYGFHIHIYILMSCVQATVKGVGTDSGGFTRHNLLYERIVRVLLHLTSWDTH